MAEEGGDLNGRLREQREGVALEGCSFDRLDPAIPSEHEDPTVPSRVPCIVRSPEFLLGRVPGAVGLTNLALHGGVARGVE